VGGGAQGVQGGVYGVGIAPNSIRTAPHTRNTARAPLTPHEFKVIRMMKLLMHYPTLDAS
jgi:hypothetical protein